MTEGRKTITQFWRRTPTGSRSLEIVADGWNASLVDEFEITVNTLPHEASSVIGVFKNLVWASRRAGIVNHVVGEAHYLALVLPKACTTVTVHDCSWERRSKGIKRVLLRLLYAWIPAWSGCQLVFISDASRSEFLRIAGFVRGKVRVIPNYVRFPMCVREPHRSIGRPIFLCVGTSDNKNLSRMFRAVQAFSCIVIVVGNGPRGSQNFGNAEVRWTQSIGDECIQELYRTADLLLFASTYEGFGLPIVEAQSQGCLVITSDQEPMRWVAGEAALLVDPLDESSIRDAVSLLMVDGAKRSELRAKGYRNVARFSRSNCSEKYRDVYRTALQGAADVGLCC